MNGCGKVEFEGGNSYWGEFKNGKKHGYGTWEGANGDMYFG